MWESNRGGDDLGDWRGGEERNLEEWREGNVMDKRRTNIFGFCFCFFKSA